MLRQDRNPRKGRLGLGESFGARARHPEIERFLRHADLLQPLAGVDHDGALIQKVIVQERRLMRGQRRGQRPCMQRCQGEAGLLRRHPLDGLAPAEAAWMHVVQALANL